MGKATHYTHSGIWHTKCDCPKCPPDHIFYKAWCRGCAKNHMSYADYVKQAQNQPPSPYLAPKLARPKRSTRGDNPGYWFKLETARAPKTYMREHSVTIDAVKQTFFGNYYTDEVSFCTHCHIMTHTGSKSRCRKCRHYKRVLRLNHAQIPSQSNPIHEAGSSGHISNQTEQPMD